MTINILVDYDNLTLLDQNRGLTSIATKIISALPSNEIQGATNAKIRLYGGWYDRGSFTRKSQNISIDIATNFPQVLRSASTSNRIIVSIELAYSLLITPREHLLNTYRIRAFPDDINCVDPAHKGCTDSACPTRHVYNFISQSGCSHPNCSITPRDILYRGAQKMVDTMLSTDLFYLSMNSLDPLIIVSSDDDFWPGIRCVLALGSKLIHLQTRPHRSLSSLYRQYAPSNYIETHI